MNTEEAKILINEGLLFENTYMSKGFQEILLPRLNLLLEQTDKRCHDVKIREDLGKRAVYEHAMILKVMKIFADIKKDMQRGIDYCDTQDQT